MVWRRAHPDSQIFAWNTSQQRWPMASSAETPVIRSAAWLNEVIFQSRSTVKTPSAIELRIISRNCLLYSGFKTTSIFFCRLLCQKVRNSEDPSPGK